MQCASALPRAGRGTLIPSGERAQTGAYARILSRRGKESLLCAGAFVWPCLRAAPDISAPCVRYKRKWGELLRRHKQNVRTIHRPKRNMAHCDLRAIPNISARHCVRYKRKWMRCYVNINKLVRAACWYSHKHECVPRHNRSGTTKAATILGRQMLATFTDGTLVDAHPRHKFVRAAPNYCPVTGVSSR